MNKNNRTIIMEDNPADLLTAITTKQELNIKPHILFKWIYSIVDLFENYGVSDKDLKKCFRNGDKLNYFVFSPVIDYLCQKEWTKAINDTLVGQNDPIALLIGNEEEIINNIYIQQEYNTRLEAIQNRSKFARHRREWVKKFDSNKLKKTIEIIKDNFKPQYEVLKESFDLYYETSEFDQPMESLVLILAREQQHLSRIISTCVNGIVEEKGVPICIFIEGQTQLNNLNILKDDLFSATFNEKDAIKIFTDTADSCQNDLDKCASTLIEISKKQKRSFEDEILLFTMGNGLLANEIGEPVFKETVKN